MEKKNILKLLALIVLMTVACVGFAFADEGHTHKFVDECQHIANLNEEQLAELANMGYVAKDATCSEKGVKLVCCEGCDFENLGAHIDFDGFNAITWVPTDYDHTAHDFVEPAGDFWENLEVEADCATKPYHYEICVDCKNVHTADTIKGTGFELIDTGTNTYLAKKVYDGEKDGTKHVNAEGLFEYDKTYEEYVGEGVRRSELEAAGFEIIRTQHGNCAIRSYYVVECPDCEAQFTVYTENEPAHVMAVKEGETATITCTTDGEWFIEEVGGTKAATHFSSVKDRLLLDTKKVDCFDAAAEVAHCLNCDFTYTKSSGNALGHKYVEKTITQNPTCAAEGFTKTVKVCSRCNTPDPTFTEKVTPIAAVSHAKEEAIYAWFGWEGNYPLTNNDAKEIAGEGFCPVDDSYTDTYVVDDKNVVKYTLTYKVVKPVCGETDGSATVTCSLCDLERTVIIEKKDHFFYGNNPIERPNYADDCTVAGQRTEKCEYCGIEREVIVPAELDHDYVVEYKQQIDENKLLKDAHGNMMPYKWVDGTWCDFRYEGNKLYLYTNSVKNLYPCKGYTIVTRCDNGPQYDEHGNIWDYRLGCEYYKEEKVAAIDATMHVFGTEPNFDIPATCAAEGHWLYNCAVCGETKDVVFEKLPHSWNVKKNVAATCTTAGTIEKACKNCTATDTQTIAATGHNLVVTTKPATCYETGLKTTTCTKCGEVKTEVLPIAHKAPEYKLPTIGQGQIVPEDYTKLEFATCTKPGVRSYKCVLCGAKVLDEVIPALNHVINGVSKLELLEDGKVEATCTTGAFELYQCSECGVIVKKDIVSEPALGHKTLAQMNGNYDVKTPATCTSEGVAVYECDHKIPSFKANKTTVADAVKYTTCGKQLTGVIAKLPHKYESIWNPDTLQYEIQCKTCTGTEDVKPDNAKYTATVSGNKLSIKVVDKNAKLYDTVYARVSVGKQIGDINYAVVYIVEIEWDNGAWGEEGTARLANIQGAGETTGISVVLTTNPYADEQTFAESLTDNLGTAIQ